VRIESGELVLDPWPTTIRGVKFGSEDRSTPIAPPAEFQLKRQVVELFEWADSSAKWRSRYERYGGVTGNGPEIL
jgi:hypothetical protein